MSNKYDIKKLEEIGKVIDELRRKKYKDDSEKYDFCKTQELFAEKAGFTRKTLLNWKNQNVDTKNNKPNIETLLNVCNTLDCDIDYLLQINEFPVKSDRDAAKYTGLNYNNIDIIRNNELFCDFINYLIASDKVSDITSLIETTYMGNRISTDLFNHFTSNWLKDNIKSVYAEFFDKHIISDVEDEKKLLHTLMEEKLSYDNCTKKGKDTMGNFIKKNTKFDFQLAMYHGNNDVTNDVTNDLQSDIDSYLNNKNELLYQHFIDTLIEWTYLPIQYEREYERKINMLNGIFTKIISEFISLKSEQLSKKFKAYAEKFSDS